MSKRPRLNTKPGRDPDRRAHQAQVKYAILENQAWGLTYLLARVKDRAPYENYRVPDDLATFEFTVKGVVRLEMMADARYKGWRRMFGSNTKARELSTWRSRAGIKAFATAADARAYIKADPLLRWGASNGGVPNALPPNDWYVLFQIQDVRLPNSTHGFSELLGGFLLNSSRLLELVGLIEVLTTVRAKENNDA